MNRHLQTVLAAVETLSDDEQERLAELMEYELAWDQSLDDPIHHAALDVLEAQARREIAAGEVFDAPGKL